MSNGSVQVRVDLTSIKDGVACFGSGEQAEYCYDDCLPASYVDAAARPVVSTVRSNGAFIE